MMGIWWGKEIGMNEMDEEEDDDDGDDHPGKDVLMKAIL